MSFLDVQASARLRESLYGNEDVGKTREGKESSAKGCHIFQEKTKVLSVFQILNRNLIVFCFLEGILNHR